ncbi:hypothetical protein ACVBAX_15360 [Robertmurraya sp. GLU-23]
MRYLFFLCLICSFLLTSCSSKETTNAEDTKTNVTEEVKLLLGKGQYTKAQTLTNEARTKDTNENEYYEILLDYIRLKKLFDQERYATYIDEYISSPVKEKNLQEEIVEMVIFSFEFLLEKEKNILATKYYSSLDDDTKVHLGELNGKLEQIEKEVKKQEQEKKEIAKASPSKLEKYIKYMNEGNYELISNETATDLSNLGGNFFNLSLAYNNFYNNNSIVYIQGNESLPENFLNAITNPLPEVQPFIDRLRTEINNKKQPSENFGVSIGMTREQVLSSSWGNPQSINTTTSSYGSREQWVYGNGNYLYFEDGILVTIQN